MLRSINADAVIVQDRGLLRLIKDSIKMPVHASTQMGIDSLEGVLWAQEEGIERVILARELSLAQIRKIKEGSKVGLEVFVHGALCYCYLRPMPVLQHARGPERQPRAVRPALPQGVRDRRRARFPAVTRPTPSASRRYRSCSAWASNR